MKQALVLFFIVLIILTSCSNEENDSSDEEIKAENQNEEAADDTDNDQEDEQLILALFERQITAIEEGNEEKYMSTIKVNTSSEEDTRAQFIQTQELGVKIDVQETEVTMLTETTADLYVKQKMYTSEDNPDFLDRVLQVTHHLEKMDEEWKMVGSTAEGITLLEDSE